MDYESVLYGSGNKKSQYWNIKNLLPSIINWFTSSIEMKEGNGIWWEVAYGGDKESWVLWSYWVILKLYCNTIYMVTRLPKF